MNIFYCENIEGDEVVLEENDSKHLVRVLRNKIGDHVILVDGKGLWCEGTIVDDHPKRTQIHIDSRDQKPTQDFHLHVAIAPIKSMDRFEIFLEKATEIGISEITLLKTKHGIRDKVNMDRCQKILIAAMKQSLKAELPKLNPMISVEEFVQQPLIGQKLIAHCENGPKSPIKKVYQKGSDVVIMIGPEGDFNPTEIEAATKTGFEGIDLGKTRLRNETAGIVVVHSFHLLNYDGE